MVRPCAEAIDGISSRYRKPIPRSHAGLRVNCKFEKTSFIKKVTDSRRRGPARPAIGWTCLDSANLEGQLQRQLDLAGLGRRIRNFSRACSIDIRCRECQVGLIQRVEELAPELQLGLL